MRSLEYACAYQDQNIVNGKKKKDVGAFKNRKKIDVSATILSVPVEFYFV